MKKRFFAGLGALLLVAIGWLGMSDSTQAADLWNGQKHFYTVQMRDDGRAITYAKLVFMNDSDTDQTEFKFKLPEGVNADNLSGQQVLAPLKDEQRVCKTYETKDQFLVRVPSYRDDSFADDAYQRMRECKEYDRSAGDYDNDFNFYDNTLSSDYRSFSYYQDSKNKEGFHYAKLDPKREGDQYVFTLNQPIKAHKQGAILVTYTSADFTTNILGRFSYNYKTLAVESMVDEANVSINFDESLYAKDTAKQTREISGISISEGMSASLDSGLRRSQSVIERRESNIGQGGYIHKQQVDILPNESTSIKGVYATTKFMLKIGDYAKMLLVIIAIAAAIILVVFFYRRYRRKHPKPVSQPVVVKGEGLEVVDQTVVTKSVALFDLFKISLVSVIGTVAVIFLTIFLTAGILVAANTSSSSGHSDYMTFGMMLMIAVGYSGVVLPLMYIRRFSHRDQFIWGLIQVGMFVFVASASMFLTSFLF